MINLAEIEKEIDQLLARETPESLKEWINSQSQLDIYSYLGKGEIIASCEQVYFVEKLSQAEILLSTENNKTTPNTQYAMAA